jgi:sec-independent protein translocase protein TatA
MRLSFELLAFVGAPSGGELLLILFVVLMLFGTRNLPEMARGLGRALEQMRRAAREVSDEILTADQPAPPQPRLNQAAIPQGEPEPDAAADEPVVDEPVPDEPVPDEPGADEPGGEQGVEPTIPNDAAKPKSDTAKDAGA